MKTPATSIRTLIAIIAISIALLWSMWVSISLVLIKNEMVFATAIKVNSPIPQEIKADFTRLGYDLTIDEWKWPALKFSGNNGEVLVSSFFGGSYLYVALDSNGLVFDYYWQRT